MFPITHGVYNYCCHYFHFQTYFKLSLGTSLVVQWLKLCAPNLGGSGSTTGQGPRSHMPQLRPQTAKKISKYKNISAFCPI